MCEEQGCPSEDRMCLPTLGKPAPDFTAQAYQSGEAVGVSLSDYRGRWLLLCFYPGDFTYV
jgi:alkyl hydroperoxide reductase subunit AhpC